MTGRTIWFTGLSGSGKSTLSVHIKAALEERGLPTILLDGDKLRYGLNRDLGFTAADRAENIRRAGELAKLLTSEGYIVLAAFITPMESLRRAVRGLFNGAGFTEIFLDCPLAECEKRDPKGLYRKARCGLIPEFTGISAPFERPEGADLVISTHGCSIEHCVEEILEHIIGDNGRRPAWVSCKDDATDNAASVRPVPESPAPRDDGNGGLGTISLPFNAVPAQPAARKRVAVIGLDCVPARFLFGEYARMTPNLQLLARHGAWGTLRSTDPPITIPAWTTITTGKDPGELGVYGFRNRVGRDYPLKTTDAGAVIEPRVWDYLEDAGLESLLIGIPHTYPAHSHAGITIAGFPAPGIDERFTHPPELAQSLGSLAGGEYLPDAPHFRTEDKDRLLRDLYRMVDGRFRVAKDLLTRSQWDFFMMVEIAPDRLHHAFWRYCSTDHRLYEPGNPYENVLKDFYAYLDMQVGALLALLGDDVTVVALSDHGAQSMAGGVCINDWLIREGYLRLKAAVERPTALTADMVDWAVTQAWSEGGYYARVFLNVEGREPTGIVPSAQQGALLDELTHNLTALGLDRGLAANTVLRPDDIYAATNNVPPDLMVYFDDLRYRSIGSVGHPDIFIQGSDTGPDDANHHPDGFVTLTRISDLRRGNKRNERLSGAGCLDITPTILSELGIEPPASLQGRPLQWGEEPAQPHTLAHATPRAQEPQGFTPEEEELVRQRLEALGYI